jgi:hypothetical protein
MAGTPTLPIHTTQFRLWHLFALTTIAAIAAAFAAYFGPGTLVLSVGLIIASLNVCGGFQVIQQGRRQAVVLWLAWLTFLVSLALPSIKVMNPMSGAWAAWFALAMPMESILKNREIRVSWIVYFAVNIVNGLMLVLPLLIWRKSRGHGQWLTSALCIAMPAVWSIACRPPGLLAGYFVWCASIGLALVALPIRWPLFAAMLVTAATLATIVLHWD